MNTPLAAARPSVLCGLCTHKVLAMVDAKAPM